MEPGWSNVCRRDPQETRRDACGFISGVGIREGQKVNGKFRYLWRAVDHKGEVLEAVGTSKGNKAAALKLLKRIVKEYGRPRTLLTHVERAYSA